jgi:hypothetical protein
VINEFIEQLRALGPSPLAGHRQPAATPETEEVEARV